MQRFTQADRKAFEKTYLSQKIPHLWAGSPTRCTACGRKFGPNAGVICPKRKRPGRWRLHCRRQIQRAQYPTEIPKRDSRWLLSQILQLQHEAEQLAKRDGWDDRYWKYHKVARQYRKYMRQWWALPQIPHEAHDKARSPSDAGFTRARNKLLAKVHAEQVREMQVGGTTYTFYPDATYVNAAGHRVALFEDAPQSHQAVAEATK